MDLPLLPKSTTNRHSNLWLDDVRVMKEKDVSMAKIAENFRSRKKDVWYVMLRQHPLFFFSFLNLRFNESDD